MIVPKPPPRNGWPLTLGKRPREARIDVDNEY